MCMNETDIIVNILKAANKILFFMFVINSNICTDTTLKAKISIQGRKIWSIILNFSWKDFNLDKNININNPIMTPKSTVT